MIFDVPQIAAKPLDMQKQLNMPTNFPHTPETMVRGTQWYNVQLPITTKTADLLSLKGRHSNFKGAWR
jgi:hypothetical protein